MKKIIILVLCFLAVALVLSFLTIHQIQNSVPNKSRFVYTSLGDPFVIYGAMTLSIATVFMIILGASKIFSKKFKWGQWKNGLFWGLMLLFWFLIFWAAYRYSVFMTGLFAQGVAQLSVGVLMPSLKAFIFYYLRNIFIFAAVLHLLLGASWFLARRLKRKGEAPKEVVR